MAELSWKIVLYPHGWLGHIDVMADYAKKLEYPYFMWNGAIYNTVTKERTNLTVG